MQKHLTYLITILILGCNAKTNDDIVKESTAFRSYKVDVFSPSSNLLDYIESLEVIGLEDSDSSLISNISDVEVTGDHVFFKSGRKGDYFIFSREGKFLKKINRVGQGPGEYERIWNSWVSNGLVQLYDHKQIVNYDIKGNHIKSLRIPKLASHARSHNDEYFLDVSAQPDKINSDTKEGYYVNIYDSNMNFKTANIPYTAIKKTGLTWGFNSFTQSNSKLYYQHTFGDTLYVYQSEEFVPIVSVDFGDDWIWKDKAVFEDVAKQRELLSKEQKILMYFMHLSESHIYFTTLARHGAFLLNRQSGDYKRFDLKNPDDKTYTFFVWHWMEDKAVASLGSHELRDFVEALEKENISFAGNQKLEDIESSENPVVLLVKFKEALK